MALAEQARSKGNHTVSCLSDGGPQQMNNGVTFVERVTKLCCCKDSVSAMSSGVRSPPHHWSSPQPRAALPLQAARFGAHLCVA